MSQSRARQQLRRQRRQEKRCKSHRHAARRLHERSDPADDPRFIRVLSYDITEGPLPDPWVGGTKFESVLTEEEREELFARARTDPHKVIPRLRELVERHPEFPVLYNWLSAAYQAAGDVESADQTAALLYERHPQYLFGRIHIAHRALQAGDVERFEAIFEKNFDLKLLYPWRNVFHISEFLGFAAVMVEYYIRTEQDDVAERQLAVMEQIAPDAEQTIHCRKIVEQVGALHLVEEAIRRLGRRRGKHRRADAC